MKLFILSYLYEVKASTHVKEYHINDTSIQWYAISKAINLNRAYVMHINNKYVRDAKLSIRSLLSRTDVTAEVLEKQDAIPAKLSEIEKMLQDDIPDIDIGKHCFDPHGCDFYSHCWSHIPKKNSVFDISYAMGKQWKLYYDGILSIDDVADDFHIGKNAKLQIKHHKSQEIKIDKPIF